MAQLTSRDQNPESSHSRPAGHYVFGFNIAMDDSCLVCGLQRTRDLNRNLQNICILERSIRKVMTKRMAFDKFSSDEVRSISFSNFVNGKNVGVIQRRCGS